MAVLPQPFVTVAKRANPALRQAFSLDSLGQEATGQDDYPMTVFVVKASVIEDRPDAVRALMAAYEASIRSAIADPAAAGALVEKHDFGLKAPVAAAAIPESNYVFMAAPEARAMIEALLSVFLESAPASIGGKLPNDGFYAELGR